MDSPTVLRRRLGSELRRLRERTGLQAKAAADTLRFSATKISRIESGQTTLKESDVRALLELYGVTDEAELRQFISLTRPAHNVVGGTTTAMRSPIGSRPTSAWSPMPPESAPTRSS